MSGLRIDTDVEMTTRDGVVLRSDVYRPDDDLPRPVLLHRTPYDKANPNLVTVLIADPVALVRAGYAVVVQDVRGRFASGGVLDFGEQEHDDGYDTVEWAAAQEWSDGQVGVYGSSYHAITAYAALAAAPPHLSAVFAMIGAADLATTVRPGGLLELGFLASYSLGQVVEQVRRSERKPEEKHALVGRVLSALVDPSRTVALTPLADLDVLADPELAPWWSTWLHDEAGDHVTRSLGREQPLPDVPLMSVIGFRDFMQASMISVFERPPAQRAAPADGRTMGPQRRLHRARRRAVFCGCAGRGRHVATRDPGLVRPVAQERPGTCRPALGEGRAQRTSGHLVQHGERAVAGGTGLAAGRCGRRGVEPLAGRTPGASRGHGLDALPSGPGRSCADDRGCLHRPGPRSGRDPGPDRSPGARRRRRVDFRRP